jgi:hypothetical protein
MPKKQKNHFPISKDVYRKFKEKKRRKGSKYNSIKLLKNI